MEELENENKILKEKLKIEESFNVNTNSNTNTNDVTKDKILELRTELEKNKKVLNSYEQQNLKLSENERKLKSKLVKELKLMNQKDIRYKNEIEFLKQKIFFYENKLSLILGEDFANNVNINNNNNNNYNYDQSQYYSNSNIKRSNSNISKDPSKNFYLSNSNIKSSKAYSSNNNININKNNIPVSSMSKNNKYVHYNKVLEETKNISRTHRTNKKENLNHKSGPALSASSSMEKIERYLMNKFAKTQLHFKSKINIMSSASKHSKNKIISSPYNKSMVENEMNVYHSHNNNKLQMNDSALNNFPSKQKKKSNRHKSVENINKLIRNKNKQELLKNLLMSNNNSALNINIKKASIIYSKENIKKTPNTYNLKGKIKNTGNNNNAIGININCGGKVINNNINIYAHTLRQDNNNNVYIKGNCEKSLFSSIKGSSGNCSARDYYSNKYSNEYLNRKYSLSKRKSTNIK